MLTIFYFLRIEVYPRLKVRFQDDTDTDEEDSNSNESYEMYPRLKVRFYEDTDTDEEDSNSYESDESTIECLSPVGLVKSPIKRGNNFENRLQNTSCSTPSKWFSKSHSVAFTSTTITTTEKAGNNIGDKVDRPNMFVRPRATVSSRDNDDLIALQNQRVEKKTSRVKKCYINLPPDRKDRFENKIVESVPVSATKSLAQVPSASKKKGEIRPVPVSATKSPAQVLAAFKREEENRIKPVSATKVTNSPAQVSSAARRKEESRIVPVSATKVTKSPAQVLSAAKRNEESRMVPVSATKVFNFQLSKKRSDVSTVRPNQKMHPHPNVRFQGNPITMGEDSNSNKSEASASYYLSQEGKNSEDRPHTSCAAPSKWLSKSLTVSFASTPIPITEKAGKNTGEESDKPTLILRSRAAVSSRENDLIALGNKEKKAPRVKKSNVNPDDIEKRAVHKVVGSVPLSTNKSLPQIPSTVNRKGKSRPVPVLATKSPAQVPSTANRKEKSGLITVSATRVSKPTAKVLTPPAQVQSAVKRKGETRRKLPIIAGPNWST